MTLDKALDSILNTGSKVKIIRLFISRSEDFMASGRQIARLINLTAPAAHAALKELHSRGILKQDIIGKQHIYRLNIDSRIVGDILKPAFKKELSVRKDIFGFLKEKIKEKNTRDSIVSILLYGSIQRGVADDKSDVDVAIIAKSKTAKEQLEKIFTEDIASQFYDYFGAHLDIYIKTKDEFIGRIKKNLPPVSKLMRSYSVIYGKDPIEFQ